MIVSLKPYVEYYIKNPITQESLSAITEELNDHASGKRCLTDEDIEEFTIRLSAMSRCTYDDRLPSIIFTIGKTYHKLVLETVLVVLLFDDLQTCDKMWLYRQCLVALDNLVSAEVIKKDNSTLTECLEILLEDFPKKKKYNNVDLYKSLGV